MANCFQNQYALFYDLIYKDKDYQKECDYLEKIFQQYAKKKARTILDVACGTAGHIIPLAKRGYRVCGNDASGSMLSLARKKARDERLKIKFYRHKMEGLKIAQKFDCAIGMFSCIDYITRPSDLKRALRNIRACLHPSGIFTFDFWNKDCVERHFSPFKKKAAGCGDLRFTRISETALDRKNSVANVRFTFVCFKKGKKIAQAKELHRMKYYRVSAMRKILGQCGFDVLGYFPFMRQGKKVSASDWNISIVVAPKTE